MSKDDKHMGIDKAKYEPEARLLRFGKKKNTKRWCKGKVGREHTPKVQLLSDRNGWRHGVCGSWPWGSRKGTWWCRHEEVCTTCGKVLRWTMSVDCPERPA